MLEEDIYDRWVTFFVFYLDLYRDLDRDRDLDRFFLFIGIGYGLDLF